MCERKIDHFSIFYKFFILIFAFLISLINQVKLLLRVVKIDIINNPSASLSIFTVCYPDTLRGHFTLS